MSKTPVIQEGEQPKTLSNLDKLETKKSGGGTILWVPEDEVQLTTKHISKNGTYPAASDGYYGFKSVAVNVPGGNGSADSHGKPITTDGNLPGGAGSAVVGTDPETGNEEVVGVDEQGNLVKTPIPSSIEIITPPTKKEYNEGDEIDFSGLVVAMKNKDGSTFTDARYPNGHIPMGELIFPVDKAPEGEKESSVISSPLSDIYAPEIGVVSIPFGSSNGYFIHYTVAYGGTGNVKHTITSNAKCGVILQGSGYFYHILASDSSFTCTTKERNLEIEYEQTRTEGSVTYQYGGKTVHYYYIGRPRTVVETDYVVCKTKNREGIPTNALQAIAWSMVYGEIKSSGTTEIPVQWKSPYDGRQLEDKFEITVTSVTEVAEEVARFEQGTCNRHTPL